MQSRWFWNSWLQDFKWIWYLLVCIFLFSLTLLWFNYTQGADGVIHWNKIAEQKALESTIHTFHAGPFELAVPAENFVILEYFSGSQFQMNQFGSLAFTLILTLSVTVLLTIITTLERFWYFAGMALFILFVVSLRLEVLNIFGQRNQIPTIIIITIYGSISYYFQSLNLSVNFKWRLIIFTIITTMVALIIYFFSGVYYPFLHMAVTGYTAALIISVLFILMTAHEIPAAFVYVISQGHSKNLRHFAIISVVYILNIIITCLHELGTLHWNFIYTNLYLLISISSILGLWGFRQREVLYDNILSFLPFGAYFYTALASICFITIAQLLATANDSALQIIRDVIIFSHVAYGVIFLTYIFSNFILMLAQNLPVHKVLYKPTRMPYFTFRLAGLIATLGFVFYSGWHQYVYNSIAGFYNNIGDLYEVLDKSGIAEAYYEQGRNYGFANNHANYALGTLKTERYNFEEAIKNYELSNNLRPTVYSLANEANLYYWQNDMRGSISAYNKAIGKMPGAGELSNNLGFVFGKIRNLDSVVYYLNKARAEKKSKPSAEANFIAFAGLEYLPIKCDSILKVFDEPYVATLANSIAVATVQQQDFNTRIDVLKDERLDLYSATLLNNYIIRNVKILDTTFTSKAYRIASDSLNSDYSEALKASLAFAYYHQGNVTRALQILGEQVYLSQSYQGKYNYIMGLWVLEQRNPKLAASYFKYAVDTDYKEGKLYYAIAVTESGQAQEAIVAWDSVVRSNDSTTNLMASKIKTVLQAKGSEVLSFTDADKYQYCRYKIRLQDSVAFRNILNSFVNENYKAQALLDMTERFLEKGDLKSAIQYFNQVGGIRLTDKGLYEKIQHTELLMLAERRELRTLAKQINKGVTFEEGSSLEKLYFTALLNEAANDTINAAKNFEIVGKYNPYFEQAVIAAADYFRVHSRDKMKAYNILVEAVQVNNSSAKLLRAYAGEALRMGFHEYAFSAMQQVEVLERSQR
jgi:hypothetical protein